ncbi:MAG: lytic transglycosylase domain-containing protein [Chitinispirillaceae bacterium]
MKRKNLLPDSKKFPSNQIWISEPLVIIIVTGIVVLLLTLTGRAFYTELDIQKNNGKLISLRSDKIRLTHQRDIIRQKITITETINRFVNNRLKPQTVGLLTELVYQNSRTYGYDPFLVLAVIHVESVFDPEALGRYRSGKYSGAYGLMQLKYATALEVAVDLQISVTGIKDLLIPEINIALGVGYLTRLIAQFNDLKLGILAYNQGPGTIRKNLRENQPLSIRYYEKVLKSYYALKAESKHAEIVPEN